LVWIAKDHPVGNVTALQLETPLDALAEGGFFKDADVFDGVPETTDMCVFARGVAELQGTGIRPGSLVQEAVAVRIKVAPVDGLRVAICDNVRPFQVVEEQTTHVVIHCDPERTRAFVAQEAADTPTRDQITNEAVAPVPAEGELIGISKDEGVRDIVGAYGALQPRGIGGILWGIAKAVAPVLAVFRTVVDEFGARIEDAENRAISEALIDLHLKGMVDARANRPRSPVD